MKSKGEMEFDRASFDRASVHVKFLIEFVGCLHKGACQGNVSQSMA